MGIDGVEHEFIDDFGQLCPVGQTRKLARVFVNGFKGVIEWDLGVDVLVGPSGFSAADATFEGEHFVLRRRGAVAKELVGDVGVWTACADAEYPIDVERGAWTVRGVGHVGNGNVTFDTRLWNGFAHGGKSKPVGHHGDFTIGEGEATFYGVEVAGFWMDGVFVVEDVAIKGECVNGLRGVEGHAMGGIEEFPAACPKLNAKIVNGIVPIGVGGKDGAVEVLLGTGKKLCDLDKRIPRLGNLKGVAKLFLIGRLFCGIVKKVFAINETLGAVVIGQSDDAVVEGLKAKQGVCPALWIIIGWRVLNVGLDI